MKVMLKFSLVLFMLVPLVFGQKGNSKARHVSAQNPLTISHYMQESGLLYTRLLKEKQNSCMLDSQCFSMDADFLFHMEDEIGINIGRLSADKVSADKVYFELLQRTRKIVDEGVSGFKRNNHREIQHLAYVCQEEALDIARNGEMKADMTCTESGYAAAFKADNDEFCKDPRNQSFCPKKPAEAATESK